MIFLLRRRTWTLDTLAPFRCFLHALKKDFRGSPVEWEGSPPGSKRAPRHPQHQGGGLALEATGPGPYTLSSLGSSKEPRTPFQKKS